MPGLSDIIVDRILEHSVDLARFEAHERRRILRMLKSLERSLIKELAGADPTGAVRTAFQQARLEAMLRQTRKTIDSAYREIATTHEGEMQELASVEQDFTRQAIDTSVGAAVMTVAVPETTLAALASKSLIEGAPSRDWWKRQARSTQDRFENAMRQGVLRGETIDQLARRVRGTKARGYSDGIIAGLSASQAKALVRTSVQTVTNEAQNALYEANADVVKGRRHLSALDGKTSPICIARSGAKWDMEGKPFPDSPRQEPYPGPPPFHWQCRSVHVPIVKSADEILADAGIGPRKKGRIRDLPPGKQASMDGQVPGNMTYEQWLRGKPEEFQRKVLGPGKWQLWQAGRLSLADLIDQSGRPMSLGELKAKVGADYVDGSGVKNAVRSLLGYPGAMTDRAFYGPGVNGAARDAIVSEGNWVSAKAIEYASGILAEGTVAVLRKTDGRRDFVTLSAREWERIRDGHLIHNHDDGSVLSRRDVFAAVDHGLASIIAIGPSPSGRLVEFIAKRPTGGWKKRKEFQLAFDESRTKVATAMAGGPALIGLTRHEQDLLILEQTWKEMTKLGLIRFEKRER